MKQVVLPGNLSGSERCALDPKTRHYLIDVRRMRAGDTFEAIDEIGGRFLCTLLPDSACGVEVSLSRISGNSRAFVEPDAPASRSLPRIALIQALPKGQKFDLIVRQATELGVALIVPVITQHCIGTEPGDRSASKLERRQRIVREALQQSGSTVMTEIISIVELANLENALERQGFARDASVRILFHEAEQNERASLHELLSGNPNAIAVAIGPEGGFSANDSFTFSNMGFKVYHAEGPVLRVETASVFAISAIRTIVSERDVWKM